jgi:hypothetical protein
MYGVLYSYTMYTAIRFVFVAIDTNTDINILSTNFVESKLDILIMILFHII